MIEYVFVFAMGFVLDALWMLYIQASSERRNFTAAVYTAMIGVATSLYYKSLQDNPWLIPAWCLGLFLGTYYANGIEEWCMKFKVFRRSNNRPRTPAE